MLVLATYLFVYPLLAVIVADAVVVAFAVPAVVAVAIAAVSAVALQVLLPSLPSFDVVGVLEL